MHTTQAPTSHTMESLVAFHFIVFFPGKMTRYQINTTEVILPAPKCNRQTETIHTTKRSHTWGGGGGGALQDAVDGMNEKNKNQATPTRGRAKRISNRSRGVNKDTPLPAPMAAQSPQSNEKGIQRNSTVRHPPPPCPGQILAANPTG